MGFFFSDPEILVKNYSFHGFFQYAWSDASKYTGEKGFYCQHGLYRS
jgi:hypothetical protein